MAVTCQIRCRIRLTLRANKRRKKRTQLRTAGAHFNHSKSHEKRNSGDDNPPASISADTATHKKRERAGGTPDPVVFWAEQQEQKNGEGGGRIAEPLRMR
jgi:hypothetical protein